MHIVVVGLSHRTAPVEVREKLSIPDQSITESLKALKAFNEPRTIRRALVNGRSENGRRKVFSINCENLYYSKEVWSYQKRFS